jgi:hypothetical protein
MVVRASLHLGKQVIQGQDRQPSLVFGGYSVLEHAFSHSTSLAPNKKSLAWIKLSL